MQINENHRASKIRFVNVRANTNVFTRPSRTCASWTCTRAYARAIIIAGICAGRALFFHSLYIAFNCFYLYPVKSQACITHLPKLFDRGRQWVSNAEISRSRCLTLILLSADYFERTKMISFCFLIRIRFFLFNRSRRRYTFLFRTTITMSDL